MSIADGVTGDPVPDMARVYDHWLGGGRAYRCDRDLAARIEEVCAEWPGCPSPRELAARDRAYVLRAVSSAAHSGVKQVIDISTGFPGPYRSPWPGVPELRPVCGAAKGIRSVYVRNDPQAYSAVRGMLGGCPVCPQPGPGCSAAIAVAADPCDPAQALSSATLAGHLDLNRPVVLAGSRTLQYKPAGEAREIAAAWTAALAPGSYVIWTCGTCTDPGLREQLRRWCPASHSHGEDDIGSFFGGLKMQGYGVEIARGWGPEGLEVPGPLCVLAGVGRKA